MDKETIYLQIFFESPFWCGIIEHQSQNKLSVCKITFGAEPKEYDILKFLQENYYKLKFSPSVESENKSKIHINPKRLQREVKKTIQNVGIGTKSQQALKLQHDQTKLDRKTISRERMEEEKHFLYELKQQKRKEKHKGR